MKQAPDESIQRAQGSVSHLRAVELLRSNALASDEDRLGVGMGAGGVSVEESRAVESFRLTSWIMLRRVGLILGEMGRALGFITTDPEGKEEKGKNEGARNEGGVRVGS
jgi:hypothetical protein